MLDLGKCKKQINDMVETRLFSLGERQERLSSCLNELRKASNCWEDLQNKIRASRTTWLVAQLSEGLATKRAVQDPTRPLAVVSVDGSQIFPDRHEIAICYLLNLGLVSLYYGSKERPILKSEPHLFYEQDDLYPRFGRRQSTISPDLVGMKRTVMEIGALGHLARTAVEKGYPTVALSDGTLILWSLEGFPDEIRDKLLAEFLEGLEQQRQLSVPCAGYISQPRSTDVINAMRVAACPEVVCNCDRCPYAENAALPCDSFAGLTDAELFSRLLSEGEYSARFFSQSKILQDYGSHLIAFRYLHVGEEIVRIEYPAWVQEDAEQLLMSTAFDQAKKGGGYPIVLAEAHELAVVRGADRESFYRLLGDQMVARGLRAQVSYKNLRKRGVFV